MAGQTVIVSVLADTKRFNTAMAGTDKALSRFSTGLRNISRVGTVVFASLAYAAGRFTIEAVNAADAAAAVDRKLANTAKQMDLFGKNTGKVVDRLSALAYEQQFLIGQDDDLIKGVQTILLTFQNLAKSADIVGGEFDKVTGLAFDLAATFGTDASSAAVQLGKALNDPIGGISSLTRIGIQFTDQQKAQIANFVETNDLAKAQAIILKELTRQVGGNAQAGATASEKLKTAFGNLQEVFGENILAVFADDLQVLADELKKLSESPAFKAFSEEFGKSIQNLVKSKSLPKLLEQVTKFLEYLNKNDISLLNFALYAGLANTALGFLGENLGDFFAIFTASNASKVANSARNVADLSSKLKVLDDDAANMRIALDEVAGSVGLDDAELKKYDDLQLKYNNNRAAAKELADELDRANINITKAGKPAGTFLSKIASAGSIVGGIRVGFGAIGSGILRALGFLGKFALIGLAIEAVIGFIVGLVQGFVKKWEEGANASGDAKEKFEKVQAVVQFIGDALSFIFDTAVKIGEFVGGVVYDAFALIYDIVVGIADAWTTATENRQKYGQYGYTDQNYGTGSTTAPSDTYIYPSGARTSAPITVNVNALTPSPEVGRVVVNAIKDYERTGGAR